MSNLHFNKVIIAGKLCAEPEMRSTQTGLAVASIRVAVNRKTSAEQKADFFNVSAWNETANFLGKYFHKGGSILIEGRLQDRQWTDKDGQKRYSTEIIAERIHFVDGKGESSQAPSAPAPAETAQAAPTDTEGPGNFVDITHEDDLPF
ncbi:MAG TPA: single-stranded DNA-binding protein [Candidatus Omnitrophota bacterium]|nr:single-stranded DNA-binding protein [Candidatus Omnitrophota bacterium]